MFMDGILQVKHIKIFFVITKLSHNIVAVDYCGTASPIIAVFNVVIIWSGIEN